ncbi:MAG: hypothetical protein Q9220_005749 [cf. Caloplaca sp. 1 TL-2023]
MDLISIDPVSKAITIRVEDKDKASLLKSYDQLLEDGQKLSEFIGFFRAMERRLLLDRTSYQEIPRLDKIKDAIAVHGIPEEWSKVRMKLQEFWIFLGTVEAKVEGRLHELDPEGHFDVFSFIDMED